MPRSSLRVALLVEGDDHASFLDLWVRRRVEAGAAPDSAWRTAREGRLAAVLAHDDVVVMLAFSGHLPVGYVLATVGPLSLLTEHSSMTVEDVYVDPVYRHRGVSIALLKALAGQAERTRIGHVGVNVTFQDRAANRTLARLGFQPTVTRRMITTSGLLRRLEAAGERGRRVMVHRRQLQRARGEAPGRG